MADTPNIEIVKKNPMHPWDSSVPVVVDTENKTYSAFITGSIDEPSHYNELCYLLHASKEGDSFILHINTPGGIIDSAFMIADAIKHSRGYVKGRLSGTVASAGTIIAMQCHELEVADHLSFMIHNYSGGMAGKGHEMKARQRFTDIHLNNAFKAFYKGFLSNEEMDSVIDGTDLWMGSDEVAERWQQRLQSLNVK
jgi:ATP-dependent protease ClpP protease subunit